MEPLWKPAWRFPQTLKMQPGRTQEPHYRVWSQRPGSQHLTDVCTALFAAALFITVNIGQAIKCSAMGGWIKKL